jgi:hypothetical protein
MKWKNYAREFRVCDDLIDRIQVTAADIAPGQVLGSMWRHCEACD